MSFVLYGLKTCDTCRKALKALEAAGRQVRFHDVRADGATPEKIQAWIAAVGWEPLLNTRSTTWRGLDAAEKEGVDAAKAAALMQAHPTLIKRPVIEADGAVHAGWTKTVQTALGLG